MKFRNDPPRQIVLTSILSKTLTYRYRNVNEKKKKKRGTCVNLSFHRFWQTPFRNFESVQKAVNVKKGRVIGPC